MTPAPFFHDVAEGPEDGTAAWVEAEDGLRLRIGHWPAQGRPRGTVLLFPGRTEYIEKYGREAADFARRGLATVTIDWRGQGLSARMQDDPLVGHVDSFADYQRDVRAMLAHARALGLPEPFHLLAHSMGGCIGLRALMEGLPVRDVAFSAPMWGIQIASVLRPIAWTLSTLSRPLRFSHVFAPGQSGEPYVQRAAFEINALTTDRAMYDLMQRQLDAHPELALGGASLHWLNELLREMRDLAARPSPRLPCLTVLGTDESIVDPGRIHDRIARWPGAELSSIEGGRHETLMEGPARRDRVLAAILRHFKDPVPA